MIKLLKQIKKSPPEPQQIVAWGTCEWGEDHYFELKRTDEWDIDEPTYKLYLGYEPDNFAIELTGTIDDLITTIDAMGDMPTREGE